MTIDGLLRKRLVLCVGAGGVGKTTTSAALALAGALHRRRTAVITVDPARRLKDALGIAGLSTEPHPVRVGAARFDALALDTKRTFDALIERFAPGPAVAQRILANRVYQEVSNELAGSAEYMAMEKLHELVLGQRYQTLVVDTPPSAHVRDLLAAPNRLVNLLTSRAVSLLQAPATLLSAMPSSVGRLALSTLLTALQRWTGLDLLHDLADFAASFEHLVEGFHARAEEVNQLLRAPTTAFVLVTTLEPHTLETAISFHHELTVGGFPITGIIANRVLAFPELDDAAPMPHWSEQLRGRLLRNYRELHALSQRDQQALATLHKRTKSPVLASVPAVTVAPTSLAGLEHFARLLL
jgi:anion-transporting  ArsA/GET3 family ATPase